MSDVNEHENDGRLDAQIEDAYQRLGTALAPPPDVAVRVERLAGARRRRRRVAAAGVAGAVAAGAIGTAVFLGGGDTQDDAVAVDPVGSSGSFVLTRPDGSTYEISDLTLSCDDPYGSEGGAAPPGPQRIWLISPRDVSAEGKVLGDPFVYFTGIVDEIGGQSFPLPVNGVASEALALTLFVADPDVAPTEKRANEVSSAEEGAAGTISVGRASCGPTPVLELQVDVTLGSEVQQGTLDLAGSFG